VIDGASPARDAQIAEVDRVLREIGADRVPQLLVFNKVDRMGREAAVEHDPCGTLSSVYVSAETGAGVDLLRTAIAERARSARVADELPDDL
jgi:GTP-binding protein HflX